jgi:hypothetical protein
VAGNAGYAAQDCKGREVKIWTLALPGRYEAVYFISIVLHKK